MKIENLNNKQIIKLNYLKLKKTANQIKFKFITQKRMLSTNLTYTEISDKLNINMKSGLIIKNSAQIRFMVTDSKEFTSIDPKNIEKVIKDQDTTLIFGKPIEIQNADIQLLSKIGEQKENGSFPNNITSKDLASFPDLDSLVQKFDSSSFRGVMGITGGITAVFETPYQLSRLIERVRIDRVLSVIEGQRQLGDGKQINKWIPDPNKVLGDVNPKFKFLSTEEIVKNKEFVKKTQIAPELPASIYYLEFNSEESGSSKNEDHFSLSEVDSNLVSDSTEVKRQLEDQQVPSEVQYSESLTPSASNDSSVSLNSPAQGRRSKKSDD